MPVVVIKEEMSLYAQVASASEIWDQILMILQESFDLGRRQLLRPDNFTILNTYIFLGNWLALVLTKTVKVQLDMFH